MAEIGGTLHGSFCFLDDYLTNKKKLSASFPYHLNLLDELRPNENCHSRILAKLFQYQDQSGAYPILNSFIEYVYKKLGVESFGRLTVSKPIITQELSRIDVWIRDRNFAIIIENKVYNAVDQDAQLSRYIDRTILDGYKKEDIYVVYMPQSDSLPARDSWGQYQSSFEERFANLSFHHGVLPWLKNWVLPTVSQSAEPQLYCALQQYIDYLEGLFNIREYLNSYYMNLEKYILDELSLTGHDEKEQYEIIKGKIDDFNEIIAQMQSIKNKLRPSMFKRWSTDFESKYPGFDIESNKRNSEYCFGCTVVHNGENYSLFIGEDGRRMYCQLEKSDAPKEWNNSVLMNNDAIRSLLPEYNTTCVWKYFGIDDFDGVYSRFLDTLSAIISRGGKVITR